MKYICIKSFTTSLMKKYEINDIIDEVEFDSLKPRQKVNFKLLLT